MCHFFLRQEKGLAAILVPGGALEALNSDEDKIRLVLNRRKGFIKLALRFGVNLVPTFSFGENFIYDQVKAEQGKEILFNLLFYLRRKIFLYCDVTMFVSKVEHNFLFSKRYLSNIVSYLPLGSVKVYYPFCGKIETKLINNYVIKV